MEAEWTAPLSETTRVPLWVQLAERLRGAVATGTLKAGEVMPSELELGRIFGVSRATSRRALGELEHEGLIVRRRGKGSIILRKRVDQPASKMRGFAEDMRRRGLTPSYLALETGKAAAGIAVAEALEVRASTRIFFSRRVLFADKEPIGLAESWLPLRVLRNTRPPTLEELSESSLYNWLATKCGIELRRAREYIEATVATDEKAKLLSVPRNFPLLVARRQSFDQHDKPAEYSVLHFRSDRYRFEIDLLNPPKS
jgi:GntR family transcriptional regulator